MKAAVIGWSGAGKSTLARTLARRWGCPLQYLDQVQFCPNWRERDREEARRMAGAFLDQDAWVVDGNYAGFCQERRLAEADLILFLDFSRWTCLFRALRRYFAFRGRTRESAADGCVEKMDPEFLRWLVWEGRSPARRRQLQTIVERYPEKTVVLKNRRQVERFLAAHGMEGGGGSP